MLDKKGQTLRLSRIHGKQFCHEPTGGTNRKGIPFSGRWQGLRSAVLRIYEQITEEWSIKQHKNSQNFWKIHLFRKYDLFHLDLQLKHKAR